jgi:RNA polymerase sigma factor (sigma-70 family)
VTRQRNRTILQELATLFNVGVTAKLTDGQLLERFGTRRDEAGELAFAAIVERHGPMVFRTCRNLLRNHADAQDAFQATFLILVRCGGALWVRDSLGPWLHRVACRVAMRAKIASVRRLSVEQRSSTKAPQFSEDARSDDLAGIVQEELDRLPDRYRIPIVLCDLEGRTYEEAARHVGCPVGSVKSRLARGREQLRGRLSRRGIAPVASLVAALASSEATAAIIPQIMWDPVLQTARRFVSIGIPCAGASPDAFIILANGVYRSMILTRWKWGTVLTLATAFLCVGIGRAVVKAAHFSMFSNERAQGTPGPAAAEAPRAAKTDSEERTTPPFDEVRIVGNMRVFVTPGREYHVSAVGDPETLQFFRTRMGPVSTSEHRWLELILPERGKPVTNAGAAPPQLDVRVTTPQLLVLSVQGTASVQIHGLRNKSLELMLSDSSALVASGQSNSLKAWIRGAAILDASQLDVEEAAVVASGTSRSVFNPRNALRLIGSEEALVEYLGMPKRLDTMTSDQSRLMPRRSPSTATTKESQVR